jgi:hypothetical protein
MNSLVCNLHDIIINIRQLVKKIIQTSCINKMSLKDNNIRLDDIS